MNEEIINKKEFGDYQTDTHLVQTIYRILIRKYLGNFKLSTLLEPTCGIGGFFNSFGMLLGNDKIDDNLKVVGYDINQQYIEKCNKEYFEGKNRFDVSIENKDFFEVDWENLIESLPKPLLIIGNPPWVTSSNQKKFNSNNLPKKSNLNKLRGIDAITGEGDFDISEYIIRILLDILLKIENKKKRSHNTLAMICKESVAKTIIQYINDKKINNVLADIYRFDEKYYFGVSVDACVLILTIHAEMQKSYTSYTIYNLDDPDVKIASIGFYKDIMLSNPSEFYKKNLMNHMGKSKYTWRSGIKHDMSNYMELSYNEETKKYYNKIGDLVEIEDDYIYPLMKSSHVHHNRCNPIGKRVIITQTKIGEDTLKLEKLSPKLWKYLNKHKLDFDNRGSSIYKNKPIFSIFGVGEYSFKPWKIAISGFYKALEFRLIGPYHEKPVMFDDTCYLLSFNTEEEAKNIFQVLNHPLVKLFYECLIFWNNKRPITKRILSKLNIELIQNHIEDIKN